MHSLIARRFPLVVGAMLAVAAFGTACDDDEVVPEPEVATLRLVFPSLNDTVFVDVATGNVTSGPITISANIAFNAQFLKDDGEPETLITDATFELRVTPVNTAMVTFTRTGAFGGSLNKIATGSTTIDFELYHLEEMHGEWTRSVPITVN